jgi:hypothetical protein
VNRRYQAVERFDEADRDWARELLDHDIYVYRELGCTILGHIGTANDIERITDLAANDESDDVRNTAQAVVNNRDS